MSSTTLTQAQVQQIEAVAAANRGNPTAIWAALSTMGDQYAQGAYLALANPQSFYYQVVVYSLLSSGLSQTQTIEIETYIANSYVALLSGDK